MSRWGICYLMGWLLCFWSISFLTPLGIAWIYQEGTLWQYGACFSLSFGLGIIFLIAFKHHASIQSIHGFLLIVCSWLSLGLISMLPFVFTLYPKLTLIDAWFETISGITTTGSTILKDIENLPHSLLFYRSQLQALGGFFSILMLLAIFPILEVGGLQWLYSEVHGLQKNNLMSSLQYTFKLMFGIYSCLILLCCLGYFISGMSWFDAITHSFSTVSTGGFSTHSSSLSFFNNTYINLTAMIFMFLGAVNFNLHYLATKRYNFKMYLKDAELKFFIFIILVFSLLMFGLSYFIHSVEALQSGYNCLFNSISFLTTTGFQSNPFSVLGHFFPILLLVMSVIGGCTGSSSSGLKCVRFNLLWQKGIQELGQLIHPHRQSMIRMANQGVSLRIIEAVLGFFIVYILIFTLLVLCILFIENNLETAVSCVLATLTNTGPALGKASLNYANLHPASKSILSISMLLGRLEIIVFIVIFLPQYWKR